MDLPPLRVRHVDSNAHNPLDLPVPLRARCTGHLGGGRRVGYESNPLVPSPLVTPMGTNRGCR